MIETSVVPMKYFWIPVLSQRSKNTRENIAMRTQPVIKPIKTIWLIPKLLNTVLRINRSMEQKHSNRKHGYKGFKSISSGYTNYT